MDGASLENLCRYGFGAIFQDGEERFSQAISGHHDGLCPLRVVEVVAVKEALYWAINHFQDKGAIFTEYSTITTAHDGLLQDGGCP